MSPGRSIVPPLVALVVAACAQEPSTGIAIGGRDEALDLQLSVPAVTPDLFVTREFVSLGAPTVPALVLDGELAPEEEDPADLSTAEADIWNAYTGVVFWPGQVEAVGEHDYIGNKGRVDISATVRHDGAVIGSQSGSREQSHFFLYPFAHHIIGNVLINVDSDCGLAADAKTDHSAWWEMTPGSGPSTFDKIILPTYSGREEQPPCQPAVGYAGGGGGGIDSGGGEDMGFYECWLWLEYDLYTLEILDVQVLWCGGGG